MYEITMDDGKLITANTIPEVRKAIRTEMPGITSLSLLESVNGYIAVEGSKKYPKSETLAWIRKI